MDEIKKWTEWQHEEANAVVLPSGEEVLADRGAGQGDGFGSLQASSVLAYHRPLWSRGPGGQPVPGACDEWFIDDGQVMIRPAIFDSWLRALDAALARFGASRGSIAAGTAKSSACLLAPPDRRATYAGWDTPYVRATCVVTRGGKRGICARSEAQQAPL